MTAILITDDLPVASPEPVIRLLIGWPVVLFGSALDFCTGEAKQTLSSFEKDDLDLDIIFNPSDSIAGLPF